MKVSVLMPAYNAEKYLGEAITSILNQTFSDFELIIIDDASTDNTAKIIKSFDDKRVKYFRNKQNSGVTVSLNNGLKHCCGEFVARMDADDICFPTRFEKQVSKLQEGYDIVGTNIIFIDEKGEKQGIRTYSNNIDSVIRMESPLAHPSVMFRKDFLQKTGWYRTEYNSAEDYDLWIRFYTNNARFFIIQESLLLYRQHTNTVKNLKTKSTIRTTIRVKKNAKKAGMNFGLRGNLRLLAERLVLLIPRKAILKLFYLIKGR